MKIHQMRFVTVMEIVIIALPLLFHGIYGIIIWVQGKSNVSQYGYFRNWMYLLHRISGLVAFVFILTHVWQTRAQVLLGKLPKEELYDKMVGIFSNWILQVWYGIGIFASCYHLANGLWLALITWGITIGARSQKISTVVCAGIGAIIFAFGLTALFGFKPPAS
jgi:succinate dehydrogenase / fumarate reductase cytochrome b subunit